jgi:hypothetical protein
MSFFTSIFILIVVFNVEFIKDQDFLFFYLFFTRMIRSHGLSHQFSLLTWIDFIFLFFHSLILVYLIIQLNFFFPSQTFFFHLSLLSLFSFD